MNKRLLILAIWLWAAGVFAGIPYLTTLGGHATNATIHGTLTTTNLIGAKATYSGTVTAGAFVGSLDTTNLYTVVPIVTPDILHIQTGNSGGNGLIPTGDYIWNGKAYVAGGVGMFLVDDYLGSGVMWIATNAIHHDVGQSDILACSIDISPYVSWHDQNGENTPGTGSMGTNTVRQTVGPATVYYTSTLTRGLTGSNATVAINAVATNSWPKEIVFDTRLIIDRCTTNPFPAALLMGSNTRFRCNPGVTIQLKVGANCNMVQGFNMNGNNYDLKNLEIEGGIWDGNGPGQAKTENGLYPHGQFNAVSNWVVGMYFSGCDGLRLSNVTITNAESFALLMGGHVRNVTVRKLVTGWSSSWLNQDSFHCWGEAFDLDVDGVWSNGGDDMIALNKDETWTGAGPTQNAVWDQRRGTLQGIIGNIRFNNIYRESGNGSMIRILNQNEATSYCTNIYFGNVRGRPQYAVYGTSSGAFTTSGGNGIRIIKGMTLENYRVDGTPALDLSQVVTADRIVIRDYQSDSLPAYWSTEYPPAQYYVPYYYATFGGVITNLFVSDVYVSRPTDFLYVTNACLILNKGVIGTLTANNINGQHLASLVDTRPNGYAQPLTNALLNNIGIAGPYWLRKDGAQAGPSSIKCDTSVATNAASAGKSFKSDGYYHYWE